jgi:16S rRNA (uracil1498-N3)-methyltransferase
MPRFFLPPEQLGGSTAMLTGENAAHAKVLRLRIGDRVTLCDGQGTDYAGEIRSIDPKQAEISILSSGPCPTEAALRCTVYMAYAKLDKLEHVIQKATELGAAEIIAFPSSRCVSRPDEKALEKKRERWQKIAASAAEQSGRGWISPVQTVSSYSEAIQHAAAADYPLFFYENEQTCTLHQALSDHPTGTVSLMTGPEGGFSTEEVELASRAGMTICSLGPRILRCETAPLCALTAVMFAAGEI